MLRIERPNVAPVRIARPNVLDASGNGIFVYYPTNTYFTPKVSNITPSQ